MALSWKGTRQNVGYKQTCQSSGVVWKSRWTSWAPVPMVSLDVKQHFNQTVLSLRAQERSEHGGRDGLDHSELDNPLLRVSTAGSLGTVFVAVFLTTVERARCKVHKCLCTCKVPIILMSIVLVDAVGLSCICEVGPLGTSYSTIDSLPRPQ